ncbi:hypothetical protein [Streptomyces sp. NPDC001914]|uniref:hypothetical protein n=1 Tax=Streptomyces sp. NPDC001914 TaxID=3364623 RepID=UPI003676F22D
MCERFEDYQRTVMLLGSLALYGERSDADGDFVDVVGPALAVSLPEPPPGMFPPGYDPTAGPDYPGGR